MPKAHLRADVQQPGSRRRLERSAGDPQPRRGAPHQRRVADRFRRRDQEQQPSLMRQLLEPPQEALLDPARERQQLRQPEPAGQLRRREPSRQLQQRERIAACLGDDPVADALVEPARDDGREQGAGVLVVEARRATSSGRPTSSRSVARLAHCEHDRHRLRQQPPRDEPEDLERGAVEPLRVVDEAEQRLLLGDLRASRLSAAEGDQEAVGRVAGREAERDAQRDAAGAPGRPSSRPSIGAQS